MPSDERHSEVAQFEDEKSRQEEIANQKKAVLYEGQLTPLRFRRMKRAITLLRIK